MGEFEWWEKAREEQDRNEERKKEEERIIREEIERQRAIDPPKETRFEDLKFEGCDNPPQTELEYWGHFGEY
jgi:hypothetical protein